MVNYTFSDLGEFVIVTFDTPVESKKCECITNINKMEINIPISKTKDYSNNFILFDEVENNPEIYNASEKLVIKLKKKKNQHWTQFEKYKTNSKDSFSKKDSTFDHIVKSREDIEKIEKKDDINFFFQDVFSGGDEDSKRAMMKSYQESNGTCLSTDWKESKNKDYVKESEKYRN